MTETTRGLPLDTNKNDDACCAKPTARTIRDDEWVRIAGKARLLSWVSLGWMTIEGAAGLLAGITAASVALVGWALSSVVEGLASVIVIWRFTGDRAQSETSERTAQRLVAVSFWLLAPYVTAQSIRDLAGAHRPQTSVLGIAVTAASLAVMPGLGRVKHRLGARLDSAATAGEGTQNLLCAALAAAVLIGLAANVIFGAWWLDPVVGLLVAGVAVNEGREAWRGEDCC
jgi:divalent metal cation (Fe/Co/Zn/Cd) transporter